MMDSVLVPPLVAFVVAVAVTRLAEVVSRRRQLLDVPNHRSSHVVPTPRIGGLGIIAGVAAAWIVGAGWADPTTTILLVSALGLGAVGLADDLGRSSVAGKYLAQLAAATVAAIVLAPRLDIAIGDVGVTVDGTAAIVLAAIWLTAITNAFNFIDGIDGMLGSLAAVIAIAGLGIVSGDAALPLMAAAGACLGFLAWNMEPATTFMGDVGSQFLGLLIGASLLRQPEGSVDVVVVLILCSVVLADTGITLVRRMVARKNLFAAHREHFYQRLATDGRPHREVTALYTAATAVAAIGALAWPGLQPIGQVAVLAVMVAAGVVFVLAVRPSPGPSPGSSDGP